MNKKPPEGCRPGRHCLECTLPPDLCPTSTSTEEEKEMSKFAELTEIQNIEPYYVGAVQKERPDLYTRPEALKAARQEKGLSIRRLGEKAQIAYSVISYSERTERRITDAAAKRYASALGKNVEELFTFVYRKE